MKLEQFDLYLARKLDFLIYSCFIFVNITLNFSEPPNNIFERFNRFDFFSMMDLPLIKKAQEEGFFFKKEEIVADEKRYSLGYAIEELSPPPIFCHFRAFFTTETFQRHLVVSIAYQIFWHKILYFLRHSPTMCEAIQRLRIAKINKKSAQIPPF